MLQSFFFIQETKLFKLTLNGILVELADEIEVDINLLLTIWFLSHTVMYNDFVNQIIN